MPFAFLKSALTLPVLTILAACATPQEQCRIKATQEMRALDDQIKGTELDLARGYKIVVTELLIPGGLLFCPATAQYCDDDAYPVIRHERLNVEAETAKLNSLKRQRAAAEARAAQSLKACGTLPDA